MKFFTQEEYLDKYNIAVNDYQIEMACEMIYSQVGLKYRSSNWTSDTCPKAIKNASMEQLRFLIEYEIPFLDNRGAITAGSMSSDLKTDYSTLALRMLANGGYLYRGNPSFYNIGMNMMLGE